MDWHAHYPSLVPESGPADSRVEIADIGCGFGGLLVALAPKLPHTLMLGLEIRVQVAEYVAERIAALRLQEAAKHHLSRRCYWPVWSDSYMGPADCCSMNGRCKRQFGHNVKVVVRYFRWPF